METHLTDKPKTIEEKILTALTQYDDRHGAQLSELIGCSVGKLYPAIYRLERAGKIVGEWEDMPYPRRRRYRLRERVHADPR